jgi:short-subunit dehydrogenase
MPNKIDKNVLIIGASQGIGKALAIEYSSNSSNLVLLSRNEDAIKEISESINSLGGVSYFKKCDVSNKDEVKGGISFAVDSLKNIDLAIINAGVGSPVWMENFSSEEFKKVVEINTFGMAHCLEYLIPIMKKQGYGKIAGVSSLSDIRGFAGSSSYCSSKAATSRLLESARVELHKFNIKVITIKPGFVRTAMTDKNEFYMPFLMETGRAARIIRKGIEKNKRVVQFPLPTVLLTKLIKIIPNWLFDPIMRRAR